MLLKSCLAIAALTSLPFVLAKPSPHPNTPSHSSRQPAHPLNAREDNQVASDWRAQKQWTYDELFALQNRFLDAFLSPKNKNQAAMVNSTIFAENVQGRVDITRTFEGRELNTEYIFGLFANLAEDQGVFTLLGFPEKYEVVHFAASGNIASASTRFTFNFPALKLTFPLLIDTWNVFNDAGEITMYDAVFKHWSWAFDSLFTALSALPFPDLPGIPAPPAGPDQASKNIALHLAHSVCTTAMAHCTSPTNKQYTDLGSCITLLTDQTKVRFGKSYELGANTLLCRMVHQNMVPLRPDTHCPHIGPLGGGMCVDDREYQEVAKEVFFKNAVFVWPGASTQLPALPGQGVVQSVPGGLGAPM